VPKIGESSLLNRLSDCSPSYRVGSVGLVGGGLGERHEGVPEAVGGLSIASSGLEMPTRRKTFPMARTIGRIFILDTPQATLFLTDECKP